GRVRVWSLAGRGSDGPIQPEKPVHTQTIQEIAISRSGRWLVTAGNDQAVICWDLDQPGLSHKTLYSHDRKVSAVAISPDDKWIATGGDDKLIWLSPFDATNGTIGRRIKLSDQEPR